MIFMTPDLFGEIRRFLTVHLSEENLSTSCRSKLLSIVSKLEIYNSSEVNIYEDYYCYEEPSKISEVQIDVDFELPTKSTKGKHDRQNMTLQGPLYYRYNLQCWEHYTYSVLVDGRLICSKFPPSHSQPITDNFNSPNSGKNSELSIFLMGYTAIMTGKDCGMNFVFKLTHPTEDTKVFSAATEEETQTWIEQINQYSTGSTPTDIITFHDQSEPSPNLPFDDLDAVTQFSSGSQCSLADGDVKKYESAHLRRQPSDVLSVIKNAPVLNPNFLISDVKFNRSRSSYSFKQGTTCNTSQNNGSISNNNNNNNSSGGTITSGAGTSLISSMRRKVESIGHKYRNRKSFAGFSTKNFISNGTAAIKSRTMTEFCSDDNKRASICSAQFLPVTKDTIYKGMAKLRVHGNRAGWMERWCQLKPKLLECYHTSSNGLKPTLDFALCLEDLTLGLSNDKKHRSALRLSCDSVKQDLLFEVQDKVLMGDWIKAFIEALGISNSRQIPTTQNGASDRYSYQEKRVEEEEDDDNDEFDEMQRSLTTIQSNGSESIYDEVCPSDLKDMDPPIAVANSPVVPIQRFQRRWSSPAIPSKQTLQPPCAPYAGRRCLRDHPLPSLPASSPDSENNSDTYSDTPTGNDKADIESLYDYNSTFRNHHDQSRTSTLKTNVNSAPNYPVEEALLKTSIIYADQEPDSIIESNHTDKSLFEFTSNKELWRVHGCSLADLIARFEPQSSESQETSSATISSKTDSSCTPTHQHSSDDNLNSVSNSFISVHSFERTANNSVRKVSRSVSADTNLGVLRPPVNQANRKERPHSLLMKKTSLELVFEELSTIKEDIRNLNKQRKELQRALSQKTCGEAHSIESLNSIINDVSNEISNKETRLKELSSHSRKRFTIEVAPTNANTKQNPDQSLD